MWIKIYTYPQVIHNLWVTKMIIIYFKEIIIQIFTFKDKKRTLNREGDYEEIFTN